MTKKYKAEYNPEYNIALIALSLIYILQLWLGWDATHSILHLIKVSIVYWLIWIGFLIFVLSTTYILITEQEIKYVLGLLQRSSAPINSIRKLKRGKMYVALTSLDIIYRDTNDGEKIIQIHPVNHKKETLRQFVFDLKKVRPDIILDKSLEKLMGKF